MITHNISKVIIAKAQSEHNMDFHFYVQFLGVKLKLQSV